MENPGKPGGGVSHRDLVEHSPLGMMVLSAEAILHVNPAAARMLGSAADDLDGLTLAEVQRCPSRAGGASFWQHLREALERGDAVLRFDCPLLTPTGEERHVEVQAGSIPSSRGRQVQVHMLDITDRREAEAALRESQSRLRAVVENLPFDYFVLDPEGRYILQNSTCRANWGDVQGKRPRDVAPDAETLTLWESNNERALQGEVVSEEVTFTVGGEHRHFYNIVSPIMNGGELLGIQGVNIDVTDLRRAQDERADMELQLLEAQKLEAIGVLAGGLAHDFNNILTGILGHLEIVRREVDPGTDAGQAAEVIGLAATRAATLIRQLLGFARRGKLQNVPVHLGHLLADLVALLGPTLDPAIQVEQQITTPDPVVDGDPGQLQQVFLNLIVNARDAMPDGGTLRLTVHRSGEGQGEPSPGGPQPPTHLEILIADTGTGMAPELLERIFEPFFTTKERGQGTGMGLAVVYGIVRNHGGWLHVESTPGQGTLVQVALPISTWIVADLEPPPATAPPLTVLLVEDEPHIAAVVRHLLTTLGHRVRVSHDGLDAVHRYRQEANEIDLVLMDLRMPLMDGLSCSQVLRALNRDVRVLYMASDGDGEVLGELPAETREAVLWKPFTRARLAQVCAGIAAP